VAAVKQMQEAQYRSRVEAGSLKVAQLYVHHRKSN